MNYVPIEKLFGIEKVKGQEIPHKIKKSEEVMQRQIAGVTCLNRNQSKHSILTLQLGSKKMGSK